MRAVFYNGNYTDFESARIPLTDRCVFFGDGVYDVLWVTAVVVIFNSATARAFFQILKKSGFPRRLPKASF